ncbi:MAG: alpha-L-fucosidase [Phycisphaerae bacterium]|nr:alpha-L-fucosidase [Phycisphaerae bacterium]
MNKFTILTIAIIVFSNVFSDNLSADDAKITRGLPSAEQIAWHEMEIIMFVHFSPATWQNREYDNKSTPLSEINPTKLDTDQWCQVAESFGAKQIIFVAKHVGDFCWFQTDSTEYSIKNTPYQNGKGDVLADLSKSCKKYGLKLGVYIYPGNEELGAGIGSGGKTKDPANQKKAEEFLRQQWTEVLTRYGKISELWFDGSCVVYLDDIIKKYAPKAMVFQGPLATLRWPGNEAGIAPYPTWQTVKTKDKLTGVSTGRHSDPDGDAWLPMEMDVTFLNHYWFWKPNSDKKMRSVDQLMDIYYKSVGRGCVLLLNSTPDTTGLIPESHVKRYKEFGRAINNIYQNKVGSTFGPSKTLTINFDKPTAVNHIITMEDIRLGHIVRKYQIEGLIKNKWQKLIDGYSVGYKKIDVIDTVEVMALRFTATESVDTPVIKNFTAYNVKDITKIQKEQDNKAEWIRVDTWQTSKLAKSWETIDIDLTKYIQAPGQYEIKFGGIEIKKAVAVMGQTETPRLTEKSIETLTWNINRTATVTNDLKGQTLFRIQARKTNDNSKPVLYIRNNK